MGRSSLRYDFPVNDAPTIGAFDTSSAYTANASPVPLNAEATVSEVDSINFDTGVLTVGMSSGGELTDQFELRNQVSAVGQIGVSGFRVQPFAAPVHALLSGLGERRFVRSSRTFSQLHQCRLVVVSTALSLAGFLPTDGSLFRSCPRLVLHSEENLWHNGTRFKHDYPASVEPRPTR